VLLTEFLDDQHSTRRVIRIWFDINFAASAQSLTEILLSRREPLDRGNLTFLTLVFVLPLLLLSFIRLLLSVGLILLVRGVSIGIGVTLILVSGCLLILCLRLLL
jgi:hypothetical protein